jgi:hypothetical protein
LLQILANVVHPAFDWRFYRIGAFGSRFLVHNYTDVYRGIEIPPFFLLLLFYGIFLISILVGIFSSITFSEKTSQCGNGIEGVLFSLQQSRALSFDWAALS